MVPRRCPGAGASRLSRDGPVPPRSRAQELGGNFVDKLVEPKIGEEAALAARRDESGLITLFGTAAASRREPTGELGAAAPDRAASEARAAADRP